ncbi:MAG TPA: hypothetical protein VHA09_07835 [Nitrososphaera sp.]|nr:hypothetical protein [Nitrososphaera sp.]
MELASGTLLQDRLFYCERCSTVFLSDEDAHMHEKILGHIMCHLAPEGDRE